MSRKNWLRLFLGVMLLGASAMVLDFWVQRLASSKAAFAGTWITASQPDGFATAMLLRPNGTCRVRWLDGAGNLHNAGLLAILADSEAHTGIRVLEVNHNEGAIQAACRRLPPSHE